MLRSFVIDGFRTFEHLHLAGLGAVNLVTGRHNVGKTALLEALRLYDAGGAMRVVEELLRERDEVFVSHDRAVRASPPPVDVTALFHGRPALSEGPLTLTLGPAAEQGRRLRIRAGVVGARGAAGRSSFVSFPAGAARAGLALGLGVRWDDAPEVIRRLDAGGVGDEDTGRAAPFEGRLARERDPAPFVAVAGLPRELTARWWDAISLGDAEERVLACLRAVAPVERIALVQVSDGPDGLRFVCKLRGEEGRVSMRALGEGAARMLGIALALEAARDGGLLLIDEVASGVHHSVMLDLWRFIVRAAVRGVQVFATTHSWECIEAFQTAVRECSADGALIRLTRRGDAVEPTVFNREELAVATRGEIELR